MLTFDNHALRKVAQFAPYEFIEVLVNNRTYGGGGIFNLYSTVAADNAFGNYVFVHEFGHHFAGLADEYYTSSVAYAPASEHVEPWEPNVTALLDKNKLKWKDLVSADTPLPTPWNKEAFEAYSREYGKRRAQLRKDNRPEKPEMEELFREDRRKVGGHVCAGEIRRPGWGFRRRHLRSQGLLSPGSRISIMFSRTNYFCAVCRRGIERVVRLVQAAADHSGFVERPIRKPTHKPAQVEPRRRPP